MSPLLSNRVKPYALQREDDKPPISLLFLKGLTDQMSGLKSELCQQHRESIQNPVREKQSKILNVQEN